MPTRRRRSRCCSPSPTGRSTPIRLSRPAATCRASSAAPSPRNRWKPGRAAPAPRRAFRRDRWCGSLAVMKSPLFRWELANMKTLQITRRARLGTALAALALGLTAVAAPAAAQPRAYASGSYRPTNQVLLSVGEGQMVNLPRSVTSVWTSNPGVADVFVNSPHQINLFGKAFGEATIIATAADGSVVYGAHVHVDQNLSSINEIL